MKTHTIALLLLAIAFAGCADDFREDLLVPEQRLAYDFTEYDWWLPLAQDGNTSVLATHPLLEPDRFPRSFQIMLEGGGAEPNIGITSSGAIFVTTFDEVRRSTDGGINWSVVHEFKSPGAPQIEDRWSTSDPMLWVDTDTDRVFVLHMHPGTQCFHVAYSDDDGVTWSDDLTQPGRKGMECTTPYVDHPKIMTAKPGPASRLDPVAYPNVVYVCSNRVVNMFVETAVMGNWCQVSLDGGNIFAYDGNSIAPEPRSDPLGMFVAQCGGIGGHPAAHPDGTVFVPAGNIGGAQSGCHQPPRIAVTEDNGLSWTLRVAPTQDWVQSIDPDITVTPDGTAYYVFRGNDTMVYLYRSTDKFVTWEGPWKVAPADQVMNVFQVITSGDDGRIAISWLGTRTEQPVIEDPSAPPRGPSDAVGGTMWHAFIATSIDADSDDPTFVVQQVNPMQDPIQVGCVWLRGGGGGPQECRNLLDFNDMVRSQEGRVYVAITDGCDPRNGCAADPQNANFQSRDRNVAVLVQDRGESLFAAHGQLPSLGLKHPPMPVDESHREGNA